MARQKDFRNFFVFGCTGAETVPSFISLETGQSKRIAILDSDNKGKEVHKKMIENADIKSKLDKGVWTILFISKDDNKVTEDLFDKSLRGNKGKETFANFMAQPENCTEKNFGNFKMLLDKIYKFAN